MTTAAAALREENIPYFTVIKDKTTEPLGACVRDALTSYFKQLDGHAASGLYQMVVSEVEKPLFETVMKHTEGNQTKAAIMLGISRSTLRKKLALYNLD